MNYRECRQKSIQQILKVLDQDITMQKTFLLLGGIRNGMYYFNYNNIKLIGLSGCAEINCPGIFEILNIDFKTIPADQFIEHYRYGENRSENVYVIPVMRELLNTKEVDMDKTMLIGHSYFTVKDVDDEKIIFHTIDDSAMYYIDLDVFRQVNNKKHWIMESDFNVYEINKKKLLQNESLREMMKKSEEELLYENVQEFLMDREETGEEGTVRKDGRQVYDLVAEHLSNMKRKLEELEGTDRYENFIKYVYFQLANFRKFIAAGSDGYYRTEFCDVLEHTDKKEIDKNREKWMDIVAKWRVLGRKLAQLTNIKYLRDNASSGLEGLISEWNQIKIDEINAMTELKKIIVS